MGKDLDKVTYKILAIDDDIEVVSLLKQSLERYGYEVMTAQSGPEGLEKAFSRKPDLILLDIIMPDMDGLSVLRQLRSESSTCSMPVILLTAKGRTEDIFEAEKYRPTDYIVKPVALKDLLRLIKKYLALYG